jgi:hypothetical protein
MTEPVINIVNAVPDEDDNPEQHVGERIADDDTSDGEAAAE